KPIIPTKTELLPSFPNPAKDGLWIPFNLAKDANVEVSIFNILTKWQLLTQFADSLEIAESDFNLGLRIHRVKRLSQASFQWIFLLYS
ncbi:MAG: hypothetical protein AB1595_05705, partial [bacterium]